MSAKHTPGPYSAEGPDMFGDYNIFHPADALAVAAVVSNMRPADEVAANAALFSAAPDLLEALREILGPLNVCSNNRHVRDDQCLPIDITVGELRKARNAIAKAEGIDCEHA